MQKILKIILIFLIIISLAELFYYLNLNSPELAKNICSITCKQAENKSFITPEYQAIQQDRIDALKIFKKGVLNSFIITAQFEGTLTDYQYTENPPLVSLTLLGNQEHQNSFLNIDLDNISEVNFVRVDGEINTPITYKDFKNGDNTILITQSDIMSNTPDWMKKFEVRQIVK